MKIFEKKKSLIFTYIFFIIWALATYIVIKYFSTTLWSSLLAINLSIILPGFCLFRLFRFKADNLSEKIVLWTGLGMAYAFLLASLAIVIGLTINSLSSIFITGIIVLLVASIILDLVSKREEDNNFDYKKLFSRDKLIFIPLAIYLVFIFVIIGVQGASLSGDPAFHLTIVRKAFSGQSLSIYNLSYLKNTLHIAYGFPLWHVYIALMARLLHVSTVTMWSLIPSSLFFLVIIIWYSLSRQILGYRIFAVLAVFFFLIFNLDKFGYIFLRLTVPDTFGQLLFLPLILAIIYKFIFAKKPDYKLLILSLVLLLLLVLVHAIHYFYALTIVFFFALFYAIFNFKGKEYWSTLKKALIFLGVNFGIILILMVLLEVKSHFITNNYQIIFISERTLLYRFVSIKYLIYFLVLAVFFRTSPKTIALASNFLIIRLLSVPLWQQWLVKVPSIGFSYLQRLKQNVTWLFLFWSLVVGFVITLSDRLMEKIQLKFIKILIYLLMLGTIIILFVLELQNQKIADVYSLAVQKSSNWMYTHLLIFNIILLGLMAVLLVISHFKPKFREFISLREPKDYLFITLFSLIVYLIAFPNWQLQLKVFENKSIGQKMLAPIGDLTTNMTNYSRYGGPAVINYIQNQIPPKSIFLVPETDYIFSILADQYMSAYLKTDQLYENLTVYDPKISLEQRLKVLKKSQIDFILVTKSNPASRSNFTDQRYFTKVYDDDSAAIFRVNKNNL